MGYMAQTLSPVQVKTIAYKQVEAISPAPASGAARAASPWVSLPGYGVEINISPVAWADYVRFAESSARPYPHCTAGPSAPLTYVSASDAAAYAEWVSQHSGGTYRLPKEDELRELMSLSRKGEVCVVTGGFGSELQQLSEWLQESAGNGLHRIAHCSWLLSPGTAVCQAALNDHGYSFVTFRLVRK